MHAEIDRHLRLGVDAVRSLRPKPAEPELSGADGQAGRLTDIRLKSGGAHGLQEAFDLLAQALAVRGQLRCGAQHLG